MARLRFLGILLCFFSSASIANAQERDRSYPPQFADAKSQVYKTVDDIELKLFIFSPSGEATNKQAPAVIFFFGGGWRSGSPAQFAEHARHLSRRGMVAILADYRVASRHDVTPIECVQDAKAAVAYVRAHAVELGIDPERIAAAGGSAGGHLAACTGVVEGFEPPEKKASSKPNAMVLFNPVVKLAAFEDEVLGASVIERINALTGGRAREISPIHHVGENEPPTLIFHGEKDSTVPFSTVIQFCDAMCKKKNRCEVVGFKGQQHGFFNARRGDNTMYEATTYLMDQFFVSLGWLEGDSTISPRVKETKTTRHGCGTN